MNGQELKRFIQANGISQQDFAHELGVSQQVVSSWITRDSVPLKHLGKVKGVLGINTKLTHSDDNSVQIKTLSIEVGAGEGMDIDNIDEITSGQLINIRKDGLEYTKESNLYAIPVNGISMLPTIMPNEYVIMDRGINRYVGDDLYVLNFAGNMLVKRLQFDPVTNAIDIISDNPQYHNYKLHMNEDQSHFHIIGKVVTTIRR